MKKKKKVKKEEEVSTADDAPKLGLAVVGYNDVKSKFERNKNQIYQKLQALPNH